MTSKKDRARIGAEIAPGVRYVERRRGDGSVEAGTMGLLSDGRPIPEGAEIVKLTPSEEDEWHDVETLYQHEPAPTLSGPPQVATPAYRDGYDRIFGKKQTVGLA